MHGQIHCVIKDLVQEKFGEEAWEQILKKSGLEPHTHFFVFTRYDDSLTFRLIASVSEHLNLPTATVLQVFGGYFFIYCLRHGYDKMLKTLGGDIISFIQNLDSLHSLLALSYRGINAPSFRCEELEDGTMILHYYSSRPGLYPIVIGILEAVGHDFFKQDVKLTIIEQNQERTSSRNVQEHTAFKITLHDKLDSPQSGRKVSTTVGDQGDVLNKFQSQTLFSRKIQPNSFQGDDSTEIVMKTQDFCSAFPYHIVFDERLKIRQCGDMVQRLSHVEIAKGTPMTEAFEIIHPAMSLSLENILKFINAVFLIELRRENRGQPFMLKGQMVWLSSSRHMIFIGSPRLSSLNELMEMNMFLADIPLYDVTRELVLLNQQRIAEIDIAKKLDETTTELKKTSLALEEEKHKTEMLLHQMLPEKVAKQLTMGQSVEAEKFDSVTILFSDIVTFTNIASACQPMDIVNMLNDLYHRFDTHTTVHNVYKVETIGDAYMVVGGVHEVQKDHAQRVANFAIDMLEQAGFVNSPATGKPLQIAVSTALYQITLVCVSSNAIKFISKLIAIRVGIHSGPVVAGVVGMKMPRYCLFGDTVNTASRMESHSLPGRIHVSPTAFKKLSRHGYLFQERGLVDIKGKGSMVTYFLVGNPVRTVKQPQDEFTNNPSLVIVEDATSTSSPHDEDNSEQAAADLCPFASSSSVCRSVHDSENIGSPHVKKDGICHFPVSQDINKNLRFKSAKERSFSKPDLSKQGCLSNGINVVCRQSDSKICSMF